MRALFDTSVLVSAVVQAHPMHERALPWLMRVQRITPARATQLVFEITTLSRQVVPLDREDYLSTIQRIASMGLSGSLIYDALIARAAEKVGAEHLLTFNESHFRQVWPEGEALLLVP